MDRQNQGTTGTKALEKILGSLKITKEYALDGNKTIEPALSEEMSTAPVVYDKMAQTVMSKSIVPDPGWFDGN